MALPKKTPKNTVAAPPAAPAADAPMPSLQAGAKDPPPAVHETEQPFKCKACGTGFSSLQKRPKCPNGCMYPNEGQWANTDRITTVPA